MQAARNALPSVLFASTTAVMRLDTEETVMSERSGPSRVGDDDNDPSHSPTPTPTSFGGKLLGDSGLHLQRPQTLVLMDVQVADHER